MPKCFAKYAESEKLRRHIKRLWKDNPRRIFDDRMYNTIKEYSYRNHEVDSIINLASRGKNKWSQSVKEMDQVDDVIKAYSTPDPKYRGWNKNYKKAVNSVSSMIGTIKDFKPAGFNYIFNSISKWNASSGYIGLLEDKPKKNDFTREEINDIYNSIYENENLMDCDNIIIPGVRTQGSIQSFNLDNNSFSFKNKTRLINIVSFEWIILEMIFSIDIQEHFNKNVYSYAGGKNDQQIKAIVQYLYYTIDGRNKTNKVIDATVEINTLDFSKFDTSIPSWVIHSAFDILENAIGYDNLDDKHKYLFKVVRHKFLNRQLLSWDRTNQNIKLNHIEKGIPSGSCFTQIIGSLCNMIMIMTYLYKLRESDDKLDARFMVMGDDNILITNRKMNLSDIKSYLHKMFKVNINNDKVCKGTVDNFTFLGREFTVNGVRKPFYEIVLKLCYPDHFRNYLLEGMSSELILFGFLQLFNGNKHEFRQLPCGEYALGSLSDEVIKSLPGSVQYYIQYLL